MSKTEKDRQFTSIREIREEFFPEQAVEQENLDVTAAEAERYGRQVAARLLERYRHHLQEQRTGEST